MKTKRNNCCFSSAIGTFAIGYIDPCGGPERILIEEDPDILSVPGIQQYGECLRPKQFDGGASTSGVSLRRVTFAVGLFGWLEDVSESCVFPRSQSGKNIIGESLDAVALQFEIGLDSRTNRIFRPGNAILSASARGKQGQKQWHN